MIGAYVGANAALACSPVRGRPRIWIGYFEGREVGRRADDSGVKNAGKYADTVGVFTQSVRILLQCEVRVVNDGKTDVMTLDDVVAEYQLKRSSVYRLTASRSIPHKKIGALLRFSRKALDAWYAEKDVVAASPADVSDAGAAPAGPEARQDSESARTRASQGDFRAPVGRKPYKPHRLNGHGNTLQ